MARSVEDSKHDDGIGPEHKKDTVRKTPGQHPAHFGTATQPPMLAGIRYGAIHGGMNFGDELLPQPGSPALIPERSFQDVGFGLGADDEPVSHG